MPFTSVTEEEEGGRDRVVPHAGYKYSGAVAGETYGQTISQMVGKPEMVKKSKI